MDVCLQISHIHIDETVLQHTLFIGLCWDRLPYHPELE